VQASIRNWERKKLHELVIDHGFPGMKGAGAGMERLLIL
jgi:hypothetical protein